LITPFFNLPTISSNIISLLSNNDETQKSPTNPHYNPNYYSLEFCLRALSLLQIVQYSSFESVLIGVKQSWQYFMILGINLSILRIFMINSSYQMLTRLIHGS